MPEFEIRQDDLSTGHRKEERKPEIIFIFGFFSRKNESGSTFGEKKIRFYLNGDLQQQRDCPHFLFPTLYVCPLNQKERPQTKSSNKLFLSWWRMYV